jgi:hypothetical protein
MFGSIWHIWLGLYLWDGVLMKNQIGFTGHVGLAECECHKNQWACTLFVLAPGHEPLAIAQEFHADEKSCEARIVDFTKIESENYLKKLGLKPGDYQENQFAIDDDASKAAKSFINNNNPNLH